MKVSHFLYDMEKLVLLWEEIIFDIGMRCSLLITSILK